MKLSISILVSGLLVLISIPGFAADCDFNFCDYSCTTNMELCYNTRTDEVKLYTSSTSYLVCEDVESTDDIIVHMDDCDRTKAIYDCNALGWGPSGNKLDVGDVASLTIYLGEDDDTYPHGAYCPWNFPCTVEGNGNKNYIEGSQHADYLYGNDDCDTIWGGPGNDFIFLGSLVASDGCATSQSAHGEDGDDAIFGSYGDDYIWGDEMGVGIYDDGDDVVYGSKGIDYIHGGPGDDTLDGGDGDDDIYGGADNDLIIGNAGKDDMWGDNGDDSTSGNDCLCGYWCSQYSVAGDDDDDMYGEDGVDKMCDANNYDTEYGLGGSGTDYFYKDYPLKGDYWNSAYETSWACTYCYGLTSKSALGPMLQSFGLQPKYAAEPKDE